MLVHAVVRLFNQYINAPKSGLIDRIHHTHIYLEMAVLQMNIECGCDTYICLVKIVMKTKYSLD